VVEANVRTLVLFRKVVGNGEGKALAEESCVALSRKLLRGCLTDHSRIRGLVLALVWP
jgi:hypothetical protein